jgi:MtN3 and saliva related transmembrane protein
VSDSSIQILGAIVTIYGLGAAFSVLLQARQLLRRRTSEDVSLPFLASYVGGYALWLLYGLSVGSVPLIVVDAVGLVCGGFTLAVTLRLRAAGRTRDAQRDGAATATREPAVRTVLQPQARPA